MEIIKTNLTYNHPLEKRASTDFLIFHHSASSFRTTVYDIEKWHKMKGYNGFAYNFYIDKAGNIYEGRPIWASDADAVGYNYNSISCCFEGDFEVERMTEAQVKSGIWLARHIRKTYPKIRILRHKDVNSTTCPGKYFNDVVVIEGMIDMEIKTYEEAVKILVDKGIITSPEYWEKVRDVVKHFDKLIINVANKFME